MSHHIVPEVYKRQVGKLARVAVLALMADKASDDGSGIWASKQTFADELGCSKQTILDTIASLIEDGLVTEIGQRECQNGYTTEYRIEIDALEELPLVRCHQRKEDLKRSKKRTGQKSGPVKKADQTSQKSGPHQSRILTQTLIEPLLNHTPLPPEDGGSERVPFPEDWILPEKGELPPMARACVEQWPDGSYEAEGEAFASYRRGRGDKQCDWAAIWAARVIDLHQHVMRGAKAGIAAGTGGTERVVPIDRPAPAHAASKAQEDEASATLHRAVKGIMGEPAYGRWIAPCALILIDDGLRILAPTDFIAARIEEMHGREIERAIVAAGLSVGWHRIEVEKAAKKGRRA